MLLRSPSTPRLTSLNLPFVSRQEISRDLDLIRGLNKTLSSLSVSTHFSSYPSSFSECVGVLWEIKRFQRRKAQSEGDLASLNNGFTCKSAANSLISSSVEGGGDPGENESVLHRQWSRRLKHEPLVGSITQFSGFEAREAIQDEKGSESDDISVRLEKEEFSQGHHVEYQEANAKSKALKDDVCSSPKNWSMQNTVVTQTSTSGRRMESFKMDDGETYTSFAIGTNGSPVVCNSRGCRPLSEFDKLSPVGSSIGDGYFKGTNHGADSNNIEAYYEMLLRDDPQNPLILRNFAQFLYEVKHDSKKAEEYYERAIVASPSDGDLLSQYAKLIWDVYKDQKRAESYYDQAVKVAPDDSYVLASYASFLWDSEEDEQIDMSSFDNGNASVHPTLVASSA